MACNSSRDKLRPSFRNRSYFFRYAASNGSGSWDSGKRSLSVYPSSGNGESCSSSRSSVASDKASWHDEEEEEDEESRSDIDPESSVSMGTTFSNCHDRSYSIEGEEFCL